MKKLLLFVAVGVCVAAMLAPGRAGAGSPNDQGIIDGGGVADMDDGEGPSLFGMDAQLLSGGSARGYFECVDQMGDAFPGNFFGRVTGWSRNEDGEITFGGRRKVVSFPPYFFEENNLEFTVTIQRFGGPGVGHWTLDVPEFGGRVCTETIVLGQIVLH